jgi:hypothetical protein
MPEFTNPFSGVALRLTLPEAVCVLKKQDDLLVNYGLGKEI